jgi:hypothetical protein
VKGHQTLRPTATPTGMPLPRGNTAQDRLQHHRAMDRWWAASEVEAPAIDASIREQNRSGLHRKLHTC